MSLSNQQSEVVPPNFGLKLIGSKKSIVGRSQYNKTSPFKNVAYGAELFSKKKEQFPVRRLYVSDIPLEAEEADVLRVFKEYGKVLDIENETNDIDETKSMFVTFKNQEDAAAVVNAQNGVVSINDTPIRVCEAVAKKSQIFVGGLSPEINESDLVQFFSDFGHVSEAVLKVDQRTGLSRCFGFVTFVDSAAAVKDLMKNRFIEMSGKKIEVKAAVPMSQQTRLKRYQMAAAYTVASDQVQTVHQLTQNRKAMSMSMESPLMYASNRWGNSFESFGSPSCYSADYANTMPSAQAFRRSPHPSNRPYNAAAPMFYPQQYQQAMPNQFPQYYQQY